MYGRYIVNWILLDHLALRAFEGVRSAGKYPSETKAFCLGNCYRMFESNCSATCETFPADGRCYWVAKYNGPQLTCKPLPICDRPSAVEWYFLFTFQQERDTDRQKMQELIEENARLEFEKKSSFNESATLEEELMRARTQLPGEMFASLSNFHFAVFEKGAK